MPVKFESYDSEDEKRLWKIVRTDNYTDVPGNIVSADEATGECCLQVATGDGTETKTFNLGPKGLRIVPRRR